MQATIEKLKDLFKKRDDIDREIAAIIGPEKPKTVTRKKATEKTTRKPAKRTYTRKAKAEPKLKVKKYKCEECGHIFESAADWQYVRCHECNGKRLLTL